MSQQIDIGLTEDKDLPVFGTFISGAALVAQRIYRRIKRFLGDDIRNPLWGLPYFEWKATKPAPVAEIGALVRREIESIPNVDSLQDYSVQFDRQARRVSITGTVLVTDGTVLSVNVVPLASGNETNVSVLVRMPDAPAA